jgi:hypothetical protein
METIWVFLTDTIEQLLGRASGLSIRKTALPVCIGGYRP